MKKLSFYLFALAVMQFAMFTSNANEITVLGSGGVVTNKDGSNTICPTTSTKTCAVVKTNFAVQNNEILNATGVLVDLQGNQTPIVINYIYNIADLGNGNYSANGEDTNIAISKL